MYFSLRFKISVLFAGGEVTSHALRFGTETVINGCSQFEVVLAGLILFPCILAVSLLLSEALVFLLHGLELSILTSGVLILEHASHASDGGGLLSVVGFLISARLIVLLVLLSLLLSPCLLLGSLVGNAILVKEVLTFELGAARSESGHILFRTIESLTGSFHI